MDALVKEIGKRLKKYLDHKGINVAQMGKMSDNEGTQIYNIVNGKIYGIDKFLKLINQTKDLNLYWLLWNEGGDENMLKSNSPQGSDTNTELLLKEIENLKSTINYQNITIDVYKNALEISKASNDDLRKMLDLYNASDSGKDDLLNSNAG